VNGDAIRDVVKTRSVTQQLILTYKDCDPTKQAEIDKIGKTIRTADVRWVMGFHIASDLGVLAAIWVLTLYERMPKSKQA
jgi:predicted outer membrane lipoprotein